MNTKILLQLSGVTLTIIGLTIPVRVILMNYVSTSGQAMASMVMIILGIAMFAFSQIEETK